MPQSPNSSGRKETLAITLEALSERLGAEVHGRRSVSIKGINSLSEAVSGEISLYMDRRYMDALKSTKASAIIVRGKTDLFDGPQLIVRNPALAYAEVAALFCPALSRYPGISREAVIHETSTIAEDVSIYPFVYVGEGTVIERGATLFPGVYVGDGVKVGRNTVLYPNVTLMPRVIVGDDVIIHAGTVVGSDGFGFVRDGARSVKISQLGTVQIDDNVEIGANNTIDRAALGKTWIKKGVKTDNLVQIAHNVTIGENSIIVAQTGISGSVTVGSQVIIGGQVGISDHLEIGDRVMIGSQSGVAKSIPSGEVVSGTPTMPHRLWLKTRGLIAKLPELNERIHALEKKLAELEGRPKGKE
ncbi:MAG: UDP-3-O-(3-hydroxymyristoyl)glucosamine N-acyltransferase [Deltaproteobacteria bacterium HGW-Deltaproteobacteria-21]|nr:MAG: UDP-3-O-(3-hydroxymyristoyl)glucosamine N-acyltransferase [Deltaproteobacteria bacterium HGW-Deltaproteobacteria-21]